MARKKKHRGPPEGHRPKGANRAAVVLSIVATDITFELHRDKTLGTGIWIGKCIHCNRKLGVSEAGNTDATVEHINPLCNGGESVDPKNLALACRGCNNEKGIRHDMHAGKGGRADEVITALQGRRLSRWREPVTNS